MTLKRNLAVAILVGLAPTLVLASSEVRSVLASAADIPLEEVMEPEFSKTTQPPAAIIEPEPESAAAPAPADAVPQSQPQVLDEDQTREASLNSPTRSVEAYEDARLWRIHNDSIPKWGFNFTVAPRSFRAADLRVPLTPTDRAADNPTTMGILLSAERVLVRRAGLLSAGLQGGGYGSTTKDPFKGLLTGIASLGPYAQYQVNFLRRQWLVPTLAFQYEFIRYSYSFNNRNIRGFRGIPRVDLGAMIFLNFFETSSAAEMNNNYSIKRTYLSIIYTIANDSSKQDLNLSETAWRAGFRFEM